MTACIVPEQDHCDVSDMSNGEEPTPRSFSKPFKNRPSMNRPKLYPVHSSDTSRFPTLERLENSMLLSKNSKMIIEPVLFHGENSISNSIIANSKKGGSQSDAKSIHSTKSTSTIRKKRQVKKKNLSTPTEIFARNLSEAVSDFDDSLDDGYVYNTANGGGGLYPALLSPPAINSFETSASCKNDQDHSYFSDHHHQKFRRPGLRSTVSELPARGVKSFYLDSMSSKYEKKNISNKHLGHYQPHYRYSSSGEEDEENAPLLYYSSSSRLKTRYFINNKPCWCTCIGILFVLCTLVAVMVLASPLEFVEVTSISNVLATQKQLIFDIHVRAKNSNNWNIQMSHSAFSVFAASHYVPISVVMGNETETRDITTSANTRQEYIGTVNRLVDPLTFKSAFYFRSKTSNSTSQIQIKNPGETGGDMTGNERWSLLIRYPYELTIRGVLKYQLFPSFISSKVYSARVCKIVEIDPSSGVIKEVPLPEQSICDES
ncbi:uncharacterized protein EV154DRAFT_524046 [Mucor mucedo]|uniref:uncharacterized protein n=1 Tax=Mucor mucedo TaxID=29922 RepID=UPI0022200849|nr:uncharacterized protein EV154DRAFT_524046 [Mucor mucedo]KAI7880272.1 hypothetical protein EV154DRAFT_524046 [Mucor mucedo]